MTTPEQTDRSARAHWGQIVGAMEDAATVVLEDPRIDDDLAQSEGVRYLARFVAAASAFEMESDPAYPHLVRVFSPLYNWGLPCPDGLYHHCALSGEFDYRITGRLGTAHLFIVEVFKGGFSDVPRMHVFDSRRDFEIGAHNEIDIVLSQNEQPGNWIRIPPGPSLVLVRQWFYDWDNEDQAELSIERVAAPYPPPPLTLAALAERRERYVAFIRGCSRAMAASAAQHYEAAADTVPFPQVMARISDENLTDPYSMRGQVYGQGYYRCEPDEAVILEVEPPQCEYWSFALFSQFWEMSDWLDRLTSVNGHQATVDQDGVFRAVISHRDPAVPNWLDTGGRSFGLIGGRYFGAESVPDATLRVVPFDKLRVELPPGTPVLSPEERQDQLARRARAIRRRFRP